MLHLENGCYKAAAIPEFGSHIGKTNRPHPQKQCQSIASCSFCNVAWTGKLVLVELHTECLQQRLCDCTCNLVRPGVKHLVHVISAAIYSVPSLKSSPIKVRFDGVLLTAACCSSLCCTPALHYQVLQNVNALDS